MYATDVISHLFNVLYREFAILFSPLFILSLTDNAWLIDAAFGGIV